MDNKIAAWRSSGLSVGVVAWCRENSEGLGQVVRLFGHWVFTLVVFLVFKSALSSVVLPVSWTHDFESILPSRIVYDTY